MTNKFHRRHIIGGTIAAIATATLPAAARSKATPISDDLAARLDKMQADISDVQIMEVTGNSNAPHYRLGDLVFVQRAKAKAQDHVLLKLKSGEQVFGAFVHNDGKTAYVRGFNASDSLRSVPFASVREWGRIVVSYRA